MFGTTQMALPGKRIYLDEDMPVAGEDHGLRSSGTQIMPSQGIDNEVCIYVPELKFCSKFGLSGGGTKTHWKTAWEDAADAEQKKLDFIAVADRLEMVKNGD